MSASYSNNFTYLISCSPDFAPGYSGMNGDISRIPIQSLSAVVSLTDIIPELPLPAPLHAGSSVETLLHDSRISIDAFQCLRFGHDRLVGCLSEALGSVCTNNM